MTLYWADETFDSSLFAGSSCAFGVFDGLHMGHRFLLDRAIETKRADVCELETMRSKDRGEKAARSSARGSETTRQERRSIALTFDIDPDEVFHPDRLKKLMRNADRLQALERSGVDDVVVLPFTEGLYTKSPEEFLATTFPMGAPAHLHVGEDFRFGARAAGTVETLEEWAAEAGCEVHAHNLVNADGEPVTATRIRLLLLDCKIAEANRLLGHPYALREKVHRGRGDGADFGFATANLQVKPHDRVLGEGVYAAYATAAGMRYKAAVSVGVSPTFEANSTANMEVHILDFEGDLHGCDIVVEFVEFLRPMMKFDSTDELIAAVMGNIAWVRDNL